MKHFLKFIAPFLTAFGVFAYALSVHPVHAAPNSLWLQPGNSSYTTGQTFTTTVYGSVNSNVGAPNTNVTVKYPGNLLTVTNVAKGTGIPQATLTHNAQAQTIALTHSFIGYSSGLTDAPLFTITFKTNSPGSALVDFTSTFLRGHTVGKMASTYSIANPTCPAGQTGTPPNCATPPPPPQPTPTPAPTPQRPAPTPTPKPSPTPSPSQPPNTSVPVAPQDTTPTEQAPSEEFGINSYDVAPSYNTATLSWKTNEKATGVVTYGTSANKLDNQAQASTDSDGRTFSVNVPKLQLGTTYHYAIVAKNSSDASVVKKGTFTTKAYPVLLRVSHDNQAVNGAKITLKNYDSNYTTNNKGETNLSLKPGTYTAQIIKENLSETQTFSVKSLPIPKDKSPDTQVIEVKILSASPSAESPNLLPFIVGGLIALLLGMIIVGFVLWKRRHATQDDIGYQSILEPGIDSPYDTPGTTYDAIPPPQTYSDTMPYTNPAEYTTPATSYSLSTVDPLQQSTAQYANDEPEDMWAVSSNTPPHQTPTSTDSDQTPYLYEQPQSALEAPALVGTPIESYETSPQTIPQALDTSAPLSLDESNEIEPAPSTQPAIRSQDIQDIHEDTYEYNEDNSMTIHHTT
jgi:Purple acid Phosphatase, N-terminal domain